MKKSKMAGGFALYFHYCSIETFKEIVKSKVLWLSSLTESRDKEEVSRAFKKRMPQSPWKLKVTAPGIVW
jgi:hypothetical protein